MRVVVNVENIFVFSLGALGLSDQSLVDDLDPVALALAQRFIDDLDPVAHRGAVGRGEMGLAPEDVSAVTIRPLRHDHMLAKGLVDDFDPVAHRGAVGGGEMGLAANVRGDNHLRLAFLQRVHLVVTQLA